MLPCCALVFPKVELTLAKVTLAAHSSLALVPTLSNTELSPGDTAALSLVIQVSTLRFPTSMTGSLPTATKFN